MVLRFLVMENETNEFIVATHSFFDKKEMMCVPC